MGTILFNTTMIIRGLTVSMVLRSPHRVYSRHVARNRCDLPIGGSGDRSKNTPMMTKKYFLMIEVEDMCLI
jgi:hypothetical protein